MTQFQILVVEDDPAVSQSLHSALTQAGYQVTCKAEGRDALAYAKKAQPHLILLDVRLPDGSGFDVCRQMRQQGLHQPIVMLTAQQEEMDKVLGLEMGADDYITKPFSLRELLSRLRAQLRRAQALSRSQIVEAVWGYTADAESERTVNVHIRRLREKIEPDPSRPQ